MNQNERLDLRLVKVELAILECARVIDLLAVSIDRLSNMTETIEKRDRWIDNYREHVPPLDIE